jgi:hypothetical protein
MLELTITVSDSESKLSKKHLVAEGIKIDHDDPQLNELVESACKDFGREPEDVVIKFRADW